MKKRITLCKTILLALAAMVIFDTGDLEAVAKKKRKGVSQENNNRKQLRKHLDKVVQQDQQKGEEEA